MSSFDFELPEIHPKTPNGWRSWLEKNHASSEGVWLIFYRASTGMRRLSWEDAVREALCFGWIDSKVKPIDGERYKQIFTPRKPRSVWSKINKRAVLYPLYSAKREETRAKRVADALAALEGGNLL